MSQKILVASTVVNLAGDEENRPIYIRSTILGGVLSKQVKSLGEHVGRSYITGPGINLKNFARWARASRPNNYNSQVSFVSSGIGLSASNDYSIIAAQLPYSYPNVPEVFTATIDQGLYTYWAEQRILEVHPERINTNWVVTYEPTTNTITITYADNSIESFVPVGNSQQDMYLFIRYRIKTINPNWLYVTNPTVTLPQGQDFPDMTGWTLTSQTSSTHTAQLMRTQQVISRFSDGRSTIVGGITNSYSTVEYQAFSKSYEKVVTTNGVAEDKITKSREYRTHQQNYGGVTTQSYSIFNSVIVDGVTRTDETIINQQVFYTTKTILSASQEIDKITYGDTKLYIYKYNTGNSVFDAIIGSPGNMGRYFPFIPIRIDNQFPSATYLPDVYKASKNAFRRSTKTQLSKVRRKLAKHESLADIDYTFAVFGVSLNVLEMACREYVYLFFKQMQTQHGSQIGAFAQWQSAFDAAIASVMDYEAWRLAQGVDGNPLNNTAAPTILPYPKVPEIKVRTYSTNPILGFDQSVSWAAITEESFTGIGRPGAKKDDGWLVTGTVLTKTEKVPQEFWDGGVTIVDGKTHQLTTTYIYYQTTNTTYKKLTVYNLKHRNVVYKGHYVETTAAQALASADESPFIVPLHEQIFKDMRLVRYTQMSTACTFLLFNSYVVKKIKWYQKGFFRIVIVIAAIVLSAYSGGASLEAATGILGANGAVGATLGLSGTYAAMAGAILNATASMIVFSVLSSAASKILGPELGTILAAVGVILLQNPGLLDSFGSSLSTGFSELLKADNIVKLTDAVGKGMQKANEVLAAEATANIERYNAEAAIVREQFNNQFGQNGAGIDPRLLTQNTYSIKTFESVDVFLHRTLLTGSDIADMSMSMLSDFATITTQTTLM